MEHRERWKKPLLLSSRLRIEHCGPDPSYLESDRQKVLMLGIFPLNIYVLPLIEFQTVLVKVIVVSRRKANIQNLHYSL